MVFLNRNDNFSNEDISMLITGTFRVDGVVTEPTYTARIDKSDNIIAVTFLSIDSTLEIIDPSFLYTTNALPVEFRAPSVRLYPGLLLSNGDARKSGFYTDQTGLIRVGRIHTGEQVSELNTGTGYGFLTGSQFFYFL